MISSRRSFLLPALGALLLLVTVLPTSAGTGPWCVTLWQSGVSATQVQAGTEFEVRGEGFHNDVHSVKVCVFDHQCMLAEPDRSGNFSIMRTITDPGDYEIRVYQLKDANLSPDWRMKAMAKVTIY